MGNLWRHSVHRRDWSYGLEQQPQAVKERGYENQLTATTFTANVNYRVKIHAPESEADLRALMEHTDTVAETQNTLRVGTPVTLVGIEIVTF